MRSTGKKSYSRSSIESESSRHRICSKESSHIEQQRQRHLWKCTPAKTSEELRPRFVTDGKQEQKEKRFAKNTRSDDTDLPHCNTRQQASHNRPQLERAHAKSA